MQPIHFFERRVTARDVILKLINLGYVPADVAWTQFATKGFKVKSRAIYFRTLRAASRIEGATHKYTLY